jgi:hypothetical protein
MTMFISTENLKFVDGDFTKSTHWDDLILENEGSFSEKDVYIILTDNKNTVDVMFNLYLSAKITKSWGDYYTPSHTDIDIDDITIDINSVIINEEEVEITQEIRKSLSAKIKEIIYS